MTDRDATGIVLGAASAVTGLIAGTYYAFSCAVMPGLGRTDDRTFITTMQQINKAIENPVFFAGFFGALVLPAGAALLGRRRGEGDVERWAWTATALYAVGLVTTVAANVPLNDDLARVSLAGGAAGLAAARHHFETSWLAWNAVRAVVSTASVAATARALVRHGRRRPAGRPAPARPSVAREIR